jgi:hypothetical protein
METISPCSEGSEAQIIERCPPVGLPLRFFLRMEGFAVVVLSAVLYARTGASWWLFAGLWIVPDLSMLGYLAGSCWGARTYNAIHTYLTPATLAVLALLLHQRSLLPIALVWFNHIGLDRMLGYGLKYPAGFAWTHLGHIAGRANARATLSSS